MGTFKNFPNLTSSPKILEINNEPIIYPASFEFKSASLCWPANQFNKILAFLTICIFWKTMGPCLTTCISKVQEICSLMLKIIMIPLLRIY